MNCIFACVSSSALRSAVFSATMRFWTLWLFKLLYVYLDRLVIALLSTWVSPLERVPEIILAQFYQRDVNTMVWYIYWHGAYISAAHTLAWSIHKHGYFGMA